MHMKNILILLIGSVLICCSRVTTRSDRATTTSGTLGSMKASDEPVRRTVDTAGRIDTSGLGR